MMIIAPIWVVAILFGRSSRAFYGAIAFLLRLCTCLHRDDADGRDIFAPGPERAEQKQAIQSPRSACSPYPPLAADTDV